MSFTFTHNLNQMVIELRKRAGELVADTQAVITNQVAYAAAVDQGSERLIVWKDLPPRQRYAIIQAMKKRKGKKSGRKVKVTRGKGWVKISIPGAAMVARSIKPTRAEGQRILKRLPAGFTQRHLQAAITEIAFAAQAILVDNTPVDHGVLVKGWEVKL